MTPKTKVRLLYLAFVLLYATDHVLTVIGLARGGHELNPIAANWYAIDQAYPLLFKLLGVLMVGLMCVMIPAKHNQRYLGFIVWGFLFLDFWSLTQLILTASHA